MEIKLFVLFLASLQILFAQLPAVASYEVSISPDHVRISNNSHLVDISCTTSVPLAGCQFRWWDHEGKAGPLLDLSKGKDSRADPTHLKDHLTGYSYTGRGLSTGDCKISMQVRGHKEWMVACRVRTESEAWKYVWTDLYADAWDPQPNTVAHREVVVLPGEEAKLAVKTSEPLNLCKFHLPGVSGSLVFNQGPKSNQSTGRHRYQGTGLQGGECGLALASVTEADNGPARFEIGRGTSNCDHKFMALIVARLPNAPVLRVHYEGNKVTATCSVEESRPNAKLTWYLGGDIIRQDVADDSKCSSTDEWRWPWMQGSTMQRITRDLKPADNGKVLKCTVAHVVLRWPISVSEKISIPGNIVTAVPVGDIPKLPTTTTRPSHSLTPTKKPTHANLSAASPSNSTFTNTTTPHHAITADGKIVGGVAVGIANFAYQLSFRNNGAHFCGASIISPSWALTAAHCAIYEVDFLTLKAGSALRTRGGTVHRVTEQTAHVSYNPETYDFDIALLRVETPFIYQANVIAAIPLPILGAPPVVVNTNATVSGWGTMSAGATTLPSQLMAVTVPIVSQASCTASYGAGVITARMLCAGVTSGGRDSCQGDSGGPLVAVVAGRRQLVGVVSWGYSCAQPGYPGIYTRVSNLRSWIRTNAGV